MLIKNAYFLITTFGFIAAFVALITSIVNKDKTVAKIIAIVSGIYLAYIPLLFILVNNLHLSIGLEILFVLAANVVAAIIYIIAIGISLYKKQHGKKLTKNPIAIKITSVILAVLPAIIMSFALASNFVAIDTADILVFYYSAGNGGLGDGDNFAFAINDHGCTQFDYGADFGGYYFEHNLPANAKVVSLKDYPEYKFTNSRDSFSAFKDDEEICNVAHQGDYFNIKLERTIIFER